jgi:hypothetical protein
MRNIREILLTQYIGAIAIGLILAQAVLGFVNALVQAGATYWAIQQGRSVLTESPAFPWRNLITSIITVSLYLLICLISIRWLYSEPKAGPTDDSGAPAGMPEP